MIFSLRPVLSLLLALVIALTGFQTAAARGQASPAGVTELCIGTTVVRVLVDANGEPVERHHVCPDGAFALFAAEAGGFAATAPVPVWMRATLGPAGLAMAAAEAPMAQARGPPGGV